MRLTNKQEFAVQQIVDKYHIENKKIIDFQAPTGSGKTFMMINAIDKLITTYPNEKFTFVIVTLSTAELPKQLYDNLNDYKQYLDNNITIEYQESPSSSNTKLKDQHFQIKAKQNNVLILGTQSFGKNRIFTEQGIIHSFLDEIKNQDYKLVYIRDEAHIGGETSNTKYLDIDFDDDFTKQLTKISKDEARFEFLIQNTAHYIIKTTATPKGNHELVLLTEQDLEEDNMMLIKSKPFFNKGLEKISEENIQDEDILNQACKEFKQIKEQYWKDPNLKNINPAMLIQVQDKYVKTEEEFNTRISKIIDQLNSHNLTYVKYFGSNDVESNIRVSKMTLKQISKNNSDVDVIIFKVGPATGWNIPRACMLVQLRNVSSESLNIQTLGRIKRNPNPELIENSNSIGMRYYYYSNVKESIKNKITLKLKQRYEKYQFKTGFIDKQEVNNKVKSATYLNDIKNELFPNSIKSEINQYKQRYLKYKYIPITEQRFGDKILLTKKITNTIELEIHKELLFLNNKTILPSNVIKYLENWFKKECHDIYSEFNLNLFWIIIEKQYLNDFKKLFYKTIDKDNNSINKVYKVKYEYLPVTITTSLSDDQKNKVVNLNDDNYAYKNIFSDENINNNYFDSQAEKSFIEMVQRDILRYSNNNSYTLEMFCKNPSFNGVYIEYFDNNNNILKSYPDFIFRVKDVKTQKTIHDFYIEIKDTNDIDAKKTYLLKNAYKNYINSITNDSSINNKNMTLLILKMQNHININRLPDFECIGFSTIPDINEELRNNNHKKGVNFLKSFFEYSI
ncbi:MULTISPECIES: DEAD/DEAH box helicase family protein [Mycoplasma mycoides group]|uniref:DEAD/DEAH box helicase family protein n=1 Tax=Mycoplasma mycoides group TaxID=656088 RepID=UPI00223F60EE|nr:DEAD/DEAH box helicase family protein [Mycoplasma mycoides]QVK04946.1 DEAD/DEAH box helicase family protein [Mycoplasma mycoides subsp. capri]